MSHKIVFIDCKRKDASSYTFGHSEQVTEAFFHIMYAEGKLSDEQMALIAEGFPGFHLPKTARMPPL
jgi:hypothetical protein